jgi:glyoxylase-like metal-dependent hydrolase (beta-lactamase superfamily II)
MPRLPHLRCVLVPLFLLALAAASGVPQLQGIRTEEGQSVAFQRVTYSQRELSKVLPLDQPWPTGPDLAKALQHYGLNGEEAPRTQTMPSRIHGDVYLVGQDRRSTNLTYMIDCGTEGVAIVDPSYDTEVERVIANVEKCGRAAKDIRWVINTHCHTDHSLADRKFHELGAQILIHEADAAAIEKGTEVTAFFRYNLTEFPRCPVAHRLSDGEQLRLGNKLFHVIHTPGHTPGSVSFLLQEQGKNLLFSGDTVFYDGMLGLQLPTYSDNRQYLKSAEKLERFTLNAVPVRWDILLPGHASIALDKAYLDVQKCRERIEHNLAAGRDLVTPPYAELEYRRRMFGRPPSRFAP